ncbi:phosphonate C-P lyase system protein PhnG [Rhodobacteraceae bacterium NNCM2]|nr:phosphonate C-P lyase system protein PhnG [Coraliihabitans acroporae]
MTNRSERQEWMGLLARAPSARLKALWETLGLGPDYTWLRQPEIGGVMVRGRMGGTGGAFNLGEMTVTRCSLRLACGTVGHGYVQGRDQAKAQIAALCDALMQTASADRVRSAILTPIAREMASEKKATAGKAAATKVDFFTLVRGED